MPLELLLEISHQRMPLTLKDPGQVEKLRELRAAGHVMALTSPPTARHCFANVLTLTRQGLNALRSLEVEDAAAVAHPWRK